MSAALRGTSAMLVVVANAIIQGLLIAVSPREPLTGASIALAVVSGLVLLAASIALWVIPLGRLSKRLVIALVSTALGVALLAVAAPLLVPLGVGLSCVVAVRALPGGRTLVRRRPWHTVVLLVLTIAGAALGFVVAMVLGLFVTGAPAAGLTWLVVGAGGALVVDRWVASARQEDVIASAKAQP